LDQRLIERIPGAAELAQWFGRFPHFHDAYVRDFQLKHDGSGYFRLHGWNMTSQIDERGYYVLDKHFLAEIVFSDAVSVSLSDFLPGAAIIGDLAISPVDDCFELTFDSSYGFAGTVKAKALRISFQPGAPA
jgi:hypothetical protein